MNEIPQYLLKLYGAPIPERVNRNLLPYLMVGLTVCIIAIVIITKQEKEEKH